ncbi:MAG: DUF2214 family protein [Archangium sp.]
MISSALLSALHVLALAIGLPGVFLRGKALREGAVAKVLAADSAWGVAALLWLVTGLVRAFGGFEKGTPFYLANPMFHLKLTLFVGIVLLEIFPMVTFIKWRIALAKKQPVDLSKVKVLTRLNDVELVLTIALPFVAALMARGIGMR